MPSRARASDGGSTNWMRVIPFLPEPRSQTSEALVQNCDYWCPLSCLTWLLCLFCWGGNHAPNSPSINSSLTSTLIGLGCISAGPWPRSSYLLPSPVWCGMKSQGPSRTGRKTDSGWELLMQVPTKNGDIGVQSHYLKCPSKGLEALANYVQCVI